MSHYGSGHFASNHYASRHYGPASGSAPPVKPGKPGTAGGGLSWGRSYPAKRVRIDDDEVMLDVIKQFMAMTSDKG